MNPFADADEFERIRTAAMKSDADFSRIRRLLERRTAAVQLEIKIADRAMRMLLLAIASSPAILLVGPPGTGKTELLFRVVEDLNKESERFGFSRDDLDAEAVTPEEDWGFQDLVIGDSLKDGAITSVEGELLQAIRNDVWLLLDEMNRADMDRIFGGLLTWLSRKRVKVGNWAADHDSPVYLDWSDSDPRSRVNEAVTGMREYIAGTDWRLLGTYNAVDAQRVFRMGQALSRRFKHIPIAPATAEQFEALIQGYMSDDVLAPTIGKRITLLYTAHLETERAQLGPGLFVDIPGFVETGCAAYGYGSGQAPASDLVEELMAEAYFSSIGSLLARMDSDVLDELGESVVTREALSRDSWNWITSNLATLRS